MTPNTKLFTELLRENRAALTVSEAKYGKGEEAAEKLNILPDSLLGILVRHCGNIACAGGLLHLYGANDILARNTFHHKRFSELLFLGCTADGGLFAASRIDTALAKRGEILSIAPGALNFEPLELDTAEFIRWALESREKALNGVWVTTPVLSRFALQKHITAKLDLLNRLSVLKTEDTV